MENKQGLKKIMSRSYFVLVEPIGRKVFFIGFLVIAIIALVLNTVTAFLLGGSNFFVDCFGQFYSFLFLR